MGTKKEITLSGGRKVTVDVSTLTQREFKGFFDPRVSDDVSDKIIARLTGLNPDDLLDMLRDDYRRILESIIQLANRPLDDPNSPSESISP